MHQFYDLTAAKKAANLSVNSDLLAKAKSHGISFISRLEVALVEALNEQHRKHWQQSMPT